MNFDFADAEKGLVRRLPTLFDAALTEELARLEGAAPEAAEDTLRRCLHILGEAGYLSLCPGVEGVTGVQLAIAREALAAISPPLYLCAEASARLFGRLVRLYAAKAQQEELLPPLLNGKSIGAVALSEECTSLENNPFQALGIAEPDGFRLKGFKPRVVNAPAAERVAVAARLDGKTAFFLISKADPGLRTGDHVEIMGYGGLPVSDLTFHGCRVPSPLVVGPFEDDAPLRNLRTWEDQIITGAALGLMKRSFDAALVHAKEHKSGGLPIIGYQEVGFKLAEMLTLHQAAQLLAYQAAWTEETARRDAPVLTHCAKVFCGEAAEKIASQAIQVLGGAGLAVENPASSSYRKAKYVQVAGTSTEISRMKIADGVLADP